MKITTFKLSTALAFLCFFSNLSFGQSLTKAELNENWKLINKKNGVQVFVNSQSCDLYEGKKPYDFSFIKIVNTTNDKKSITYNYIHQFIEGCDGCDNNAEKVYTKTIEANSSIEGNCDFQNGNGLSSPIKNNNFDGGWTFESVEIKISSVK